MYALDSQSWHRRRFQWPSSLTITIQNAGISRHSVAARLLEEEGPHDNLRDAIAVLYAAGADTVCVHKSSMALRICIQP
jgi:hypothetical protein